MAVPPGRDSEKGIVLVIVIIVIAILMILVTDLIYFTQIDSEISMNTRDEVKARYIAKSGVQVAAGAFSAQALEELSAMMGSVGGSAGRDDGLWALSVPYFPVGQGSVSITITDERSKINLNSLVSTDSNIVDQQVLAELRELFRLLGVDTSKSERFLSSLVNWLDVPKEGTVNDQDSVGANADFYAGLQPAYRIKDGPLDTVEEIRMVDGMDDEFYNTVKDYVTVYPIDKKINFSTASRVVMVSALKAATVPAIPGQGSQVDPIDDSTAEQIVDEIIEARKNDPIVDSKKVRDIVRDVDPTSQIIAGLVGLGQGTGESEVFTVRSEGILGEASPTRRIIEAVMKKKRQGREFIVDIVTWKEL
ncbi:MAG: general secretion pathway protein GspK [Candidatus Dadabacteria bacterium]|nr:general secretion pathway protein GspK [Candidatus Dadabacteria bacterium]